MENNIWAINRELSKLIVEGINLPSSKVAVRSVFGDILTPDGLIKDLRTSGLSNEEYTAKVKRLLSTIPEFFDVETIKKQEVDRLERLIMNYNKTTTPSKWINTQGMSFSQLTEAAHEIGVKTANLNIYDPRFGMTIRDVLASFKDQISGDGE